MTHGRGWLRLFLPDRPVRCLTDKASPAQEKPFSDFLLFLPSCRIARQRSRSRLFSAAKAFQASMMSVSIPLVALDMRQGVLRCL